MHTHMHVLTGAEDVFLVHGRDTGTPLLSWVRLTGSFAIAYN